MHGISLDEAAGRAWGSLSREVSNTYLKSELDQLLMPSSALPRPVR